MVEPLPSVVQGTATLYITKEPVPVLPLMAPLPSPQLLLSRFRNGLVVGRTATLHDVAPPLVANNCGFLPSLETKTPMLYLVDDPNCTVT